MKKIEKILGSINNNLNYYYLIFLIIYSLLYIFITPPFGSPDEHNHFRKAANSEKIYIFGDLRIDKNIQNFSEEIKNNLFGKKKIDINSYFKSESKNKFSEDFETADLANLSGYPYYAYIFPKIGFNLSKFFSDNILKAFYLGRFFNLFLFIFCSYLLIKSNFHKDYFYTLIFFPTTLSLVNSYNADSFIISMTCLYVFFFFKFKTTYNTSHIIYCNLIILLISLIKPVYIFLVLINLLFFKKNFKINLLIYSLISFVMFIYFYDYPVMPIDNNLEKKYKIINFLISEPTKTFKLIFLTLAIETKFYLYETISSVGHMLNINYYFNIYVLTLLYFSYLIFKNLKFNKKTFYLFLILFVTAIAVMMTIYLNTNSIEKFETIKNVRGRYFLILLFLISCGFYFQNDKKIFNKNKYIFINLLVIIVLINLIDILSIKANIIFLMFSYLIVYKEYFKIFYKIIFPHFNLLILFNIYNYYY